MNKVLPVVYFIGLLGALSASAASDPVSWSVSPHTGFPATKVGEQSIVHYTFSNNLPFATKLGIHPQINGGNFSLHNDCSTLAAGASCVVAVAFNPAAAKTATFQLSYGYNNNRIPLPALSAQGMKHSNSQLLGSLIGLPPAFYKGNTVQFNAVYTNRGTTPLIGCTYSAFTSSGVPATLTTGAGIPPCGDVLLAGASCQQRGTVHSSTAGALTITGHASCASLQANPKTSSLVLNNTGCLVSAAVSLPLPEQTYQYASNIVQYKFVNQCATAQKLGAVSIAADGNATLTKGTDTCSGALLKSLATCSVDAAVMPNALTPDLSVSASVAYNNNTRSASAHTSTAVQSIPNQASQHTVTFVNQCDYPVWYAFTNGNNGAVYPSSPDPTPANARTFADYELKGQVPGMPPATKVLAVKEYLNGALYARTGCNPATGVCETANCTVIANTATCQLGAQPAPPQTKFELNLAASGYDGIYDLSLLNGFNVPGAIHSLAPVFSGPTPAGNIPYPFNCGQTAGGLIQPKNGLGACPWTFTTPDIAANYQWVAGDSAGSPCNDDNQCTDGVCGMTSPDASGQINRRCGKFLGYWTLADYIGYSAASQWENGYNLYNYYNMASKLTPIGTGINDYGQFKAGSPATFIDANYAAMFGCIPTTTGALDTGYNYHSHNNDKVCGCYNWNQSGSLAKTAQVTACTGFNSQWQNTVFPKILWLKQACPTAYSYQFDDKSSQFQCNRPGIKTSYQITFCPGGVTGKPA